MPAIRNGRSALIGDDQFSHLLQGRLLIAADEPLGVRGRVIQSDTVADAPAAHLPEDQAQRVDVGSAKALQALRIEAGREESCLDCVL